VTDTRGDPDLATTLVVADSPERVERAVLISGEALD
jgi:hypothetical protein